VARQVRYSERAARDAIAASRSYSEALRRLGMRPAGGNHATLRRYAERVWRIPTDHFDPYAHRRQRRSVSVARPLEEVLVEGSTYDRGSLKRRLFETGLKARRCEMCGVGERWHGRPMALVLDHVNGVADDNRLENLQIVCANCAATLDTHCGRNLPRPCSRCGKAFRPSFKAQKYCTRDCWAASDSARRDRPDRRRVPRPSHEQLLADLATMTWVAVGAKYGVSDNAVRKWLRRYETGPEGPRSASLRSAA
jgi:hypothetical protein